MNKLPAINLARLPFPDVIQNLDYEAILSILVSRFQVIWAERREENPDLPAYDVEFLETDPGKIVLEVGSYAVLNVLQEINDAAKALMLATTSGSNLDNFAADFNMERLTVTPATDTSPAVMESDPDFKLRRQLAPEGYAAAGPEGAYEYFSLSADASIRQARAVRGQDNRVDIILLGRNGDGAVDQAVIEKVYTALSPKKTRPLTDNVYVRSARIVYQTIHVRIRVESGPDASALVTKAREGIQSYISERSSIGTALRTDGIISGARQNNPVEKVEVLEPAFDVEPGPFDFIYVPEIIVDLSP
ncbi:hypothetical protein FG152_09760 [Ochrobactrum sp. XJ1]|nr:hypothetical protein [Ochrobactrum sp. XJ1]